MSAYACDPQQGSEPGVGWHWALEAVHAGHEVWAVTRKNNRAAIEAALDANPQPDLHFEFVDLPAPFLWLKHRLGHAGLIGYYYVWQLRLAARARRLHRRVDFDVAHHVTFGNDQLPSGLAFLPIPFVWGPVGGSTHRLPRTIELNLPRYAQWQERVRVAMEFVLKHLDPFARFTRKRATVILTYTKEALGGLRPAEQLRARAIVHIGVSEHELPPRDEEPARQRRGLRILTGGRLVHWKGYDLLIEGFARFMRGRPDSDARLVITGSGPFQPRLESLVRRDRLQSRVAFVGRVPTREDVARLMGNSDLFALPTLRDGPPVALLEAMAAGLPVLCLDLGATAELVPDGAGFKIEPRSRQYVIEEIAAALATLESERDRAIEMGRFARRHALHEHDWRVIREELERAYSDAVFGAR